MIRYKRVSSIRGDKEKDVFRPNKIITSPILVNEDTIVNKETLLLREAKFNEKVKTEFSKQIGDTELVLITFKDNSCVYVIGDFEEELHDFNWIKEMRT